jgi:hypothetical protein
MTNLIIFTPRPNGQKQPSTPVLVPPAPDQPPDCAPVPQGQPIPARPEKELPSFGPPLGLMNDTEAITLGRLALSTLLSGWPSLESYDPALVEIAIARLGGLLSQVALSEALADPYIGAPGPRGWVVPSAGSGGGEAA